MTAAPSHPAPLYKVLGPDRMPHHGGRGQWPPPGEWLEATGALKPCSNGLHLCRAKDLVLWLGPEIWTAEADGEVIDHDDKVVVRRARLISRVETWTERTARLFAADCAEHVLPIYEAAHPSDTRPRDAIVAAHAYARGDIDDAAGAAAWAAAWAAAGAAAGAAARDAAWAAEQSWQTDRLMAYLRGGAR